MITIQKEFWQSNLGDAYIKRNPLTVAELDESYIKKYGVSRTEMNKRFLSDLKIENVLEVGCNIGTQLKVLQEQGYNNLYGIEINPETVELAKKDSCHLNIIYGDALDNPFKDNLFDLVFTSGVLMHISPKDVTTALREIYRVSKKYIWGLEYFSSDYGEVDYRGNKDLLWKGDFAKMYCDLFPGLRLIKEEKFKYLDSENIDAVFLLEKT